MNKTPPKWLLPVGAVICALAWGSAFPGIKFLYAQLETLGVERSWPVILLLAGARFFTAGLLLLSITRLDWHAIRKAPKAPLIGFGMLQTYLQYVIFYAAISIASGTLLSLLTVSGNFFWVILAPLLLKTEWPRKTQWALLILGTVGVSWAVAQPGAGAGRPVLGAFLLCCATFCGALALIVLQSVKDHVSTRSATCLSLLGGGLLLLLTAFPAWSQFALIFSQAKVLAMTLYLAAVSAVGFGLWNYLTTLFSVNVLAGYRFLIPIAGVSLSSFFIPGETPGIGILAGGCLVLVSVIGLQRLKARPAGQIR